MSRIRTGWRLAKASFALVRADRSLAIFPLLSTAFAAAALALTLTPGLIWSAALDRDWIVLPFIVLGGFATTFFVVYFNVALAGAARRSMDGRDTSVSDGLAVARERRGLILRWALLQFFVGVGLKVVQYLAGDSVAGRLIAIGTGLASAAWSVSTFFVIPVLALEGLGPGAAMKRSVGLVRRHWGEGLVGSAAIGLAVSLAAALPLAFLFNLASVMIDVQVVAGAVLGVVAIVALIATLAMGSALGVIFRVELYRYGTEGRATGSFAERDLLAAFRPPGREAAR